MKGPVIGSVVLHTAAMALAVFGLPRLMDVPPMQSQPMMMELVSAVDMQPIEAAPAPPEPENAAAATPEPAQSAETPAAAPAPAPTPERATAAATPEPAAPAQAAPPAAAAPPPPVPAARPQQLAAAPAPAPPKPEPAAPPARPEPARLAALPKPQRKPAVPETAPAPSPEATRAPPPEPSKPEPEKAEAAKPPEPEKAPQDKAKPAEPEIAKPAEPEKVEPVPTAPPAQVAAVPPPQAKPAPPAARPPQPKEPAFSLDRVQALLDKRAGAQPKAPAPENRGDPLKSIRVTTQSRASRPLSQGVIDGIRRQIEACWSLPAGAPDAGDLMVTLRVELQPDGTVRDADIVSTDRMGNDYYRVAAESALRAVRNPRCNPLRGLPPDRYEEWRVLDLNFNPRDMVGG